MSKSPFLVITSIADDKHPVLNQYAAACQAKGVPFIVIGDVKSPNDFQLAGCDFYSIEKQLQLPHTLAREIPVKHYARKNIGYLIALQQGAEVIIETDDDNIPYESFGPRVHPKFRQINCRIMAGSMSINTSARRISGQEVFLWTKSWNP